jgi:uncharacterized alkaline shock family protein YloU
MNTKVNSGKITIAPEVLATTARLTTLAVPGVVRLISPAGMRHFLQDDGVKVKIIDGEVYVKLYIVVDSDVSMLNVGRKVQSEVTRALQEMVGVKVKSVDIYIEDVASSSKKA